jgi:hypothetical protein|tara:strand:+ start:339 stop:476 length:138 start_codon:yes stop_codon:yes gene_type:complete
MNATEWRHRPPWPAGVAAAGVVVIVVATASFAKPRWRNDLIAALE